MQLDNALISVNNFKNNPKTSRTNCTTKGRKETASKKVERTETLLGTKEPWAIQRRERSAGKEKEEKQTLTLGSPYREEESP